MKNDDNLSEMLKFRYCEKATKFGKKNLPIGRFFFRFCVLLRKFNQNETGLGHLIRST